mgnify:CR=1 FL=1
MSEKTFAFTISSKCIERGYVVASNLEEAKEKIANEEWDDIYDTIDTTYEELIDIEESD